MNLKERNEDTKNVLLLFSNFFFKYQRIERIHAKVKSFFDRHTHYSHFFIINYFYFHFRYTFFPFFIKLC